MFKTQHEQRKYKEGYDKYFKERGHIDKLIEMSIDHLETKKNDDRLTLESKYGKDHFEVKKYVINQEKDASRFKKDEDGNYVGPYALMNDSKKYINEMLDKRNRLEIKIGELKEK